MILEQLRLKHPRLIYKKYAITQGADTITIDYEFLLEPDIVFRPTVSIPFFGLIETDFLAPHAFNLGLVEAISYWKTACPKELVVEAGFLDREQMRFWYDLFLHGLGEFFYRNKIDFSQKDFLTITALKSPDIQYTKPEIQSSGDLVLVGGGKDSAVTLGILKKSDRTIQTMVLNPTQAALDLCRISGYNKPIVIKRTMDPVLFSLNDSGYLNGHTPFSAYLAFLGSMVAALYGYEYVIVSNERSANEGNVMYRGMEINHQYSKSFRFEEAFRTQHPSYFSLLRPLNDIQISMLFAQFPQFFQSFRSCNVGSKTNTWCGACAKCAFTFLVFFPFLTYQDMMRIFGSDYFRNPAIVSLIRELVGLTPVKPFECVGTRDESKLAVYLAVEHYRKEGVEIPEEILKIKSDLAFTEQEVARLQEACINNLGDTYNVPEEYQAILRKARERVN